MGCETIDLTDGWRASLQQEGPWLCARLLPGGHSHWGIADGLWDAIYERGKLSVMMEMDDIEFFPSALMVELVRLHKRIAMAGGRLRISGLRKHPHEALKTMRLDEVLPIYGSREEALQ